MAIPIRATKPATPAAVAEAVGGLGVGGGGRGLETAPTVPPPDTTNEDARIPPGTMISDRYRIASVLGEGGMGVVYLAEHILMRKEVAVKVLHAEMCEMPEVVARFEREAIAAGSVDHPNVAHATDFGRLEDGSCFLVLELLRGVSLRDEIAKGPIPLTRTLRLMRGITAGVAAAHAKGVIHRDLKPENVMLVDRDGSIADFPKVLDFGIAKLDPTAGAAAQAGGKVLTRVGSVFGTPEYMAPEQAVGDIVDARADLYALGVILLEMLTGKCPFQGNALSILRERILAVGPPDMSAIADEGAKQLIARLLTKEPDDRMQTANELVSAIDTLLGENGGAGKAASLPPPPSPSGKTFPPPADASSASLANANASAKGGRPKWMIPAIGVVAASAIMFGAFTLVSALTKPHATTSSSSHPRSDSSSSSSQSSSAVASADPPTPSSASSAATTADSSEAVDLDIPPTAPTASAASARTTPRKPVAKPRPKNKGFNIPSPKDLLK